MTLMYKQDIVLLCRVEENIGPITNIEVLKVLERRGANREWSRKKTLPSERKVALRVLRYLMWDTVV